MGYLVQVDATKFDGIRDQRRAADLWYAGTRLTCGVFCGSFGPLLHGRADFVKEQVVGTNAWKSGPLPPSCLLGGTRRFSLGRFFLCRLPLSLPAASDRHKKNLPRENLLVPPAPLPPSCLLGGTRRFSLGRFFLCRLPLSLPATSERHKKNLPREILLVPSLFSYAIVLQKGFINFSSLKQNFFLIINYIRLA